jgi:diguanylate cyclase (GGDEF)-like protein
LLIDIDHFKQINDTHGHPAGDAVLVAIARVLKRAVRPTDGVGRLGGEEFIIVLPATSLQNSAVVGERVRHNVEAEKFSFQGKQLHVTVSIGAATYPSPGIKGKDQLLKAADEALYKAKHAGRNRLILSEKVA